MRVNGYGGYDWKVDSTSRQRPEVPESQVATSSTEKSVNVVRKVASDGDQRTAFARLVARAADMGRSQFQALSAYLTTSSYKPLDETNSVELVGVDTYV
ncbi:hypothetical protein ACKC9G_03305 [Pokkaliibacter sp. CJK22405]|uniref:hypothetical protein n=1 Tax=Pokkaliibacter sp. CJK22405 TaxID=3384615 RepID=UPI0039855B47